MIGGSGGLTWGPGMMRQPTCGKEWCKGVMHEGPKRTCLFVYGWRVLVILVTSWDRYGVRTRPGCLTSRHTKQSMGPGQAPHDHSHNMATYNITMWCQCGVSRLCPETGHGSAGTPQCAETPNESTSSAAQPEAGVPKRWARTRHEAHGCIMHGGTRSRKK